MIKIFQRLQNSSSKLKAIYLSWILLHFILLLTAGNMLDIHDRFFPDRWRLGYYDITEFLIYTLSPIFIFYIVSFWNERK
ncbi:MAG: hypothetical protein KF816_02880 [Melioribacteraceae bacterium]|nr:hypothetical protein [Melioribacteraceae bacterium]